jgi:hypothetical protein
MHARYQYVLAAAIALSGVAGWAETPAPPSATSASAVLAEGTPVHLVLARTVSSQSDQAGELVEFELKQSIVLNGTVLLPENSYVYGKVVSATMDDRESGKPGSLEFRLDSLKLANGQEIPLRTVKQIPSAANTDIKPEKLTNLVNSPYAPFGHFNNGTTTTVPKNSMLTLFVGADVTIGGSVVVRAGAQDSGADSLASRIINSNSGAKSLGDVAREQRDRGKIGGGMVSSPQQ